MTAMGSEFLPSNIELPFFSYGLFKPTKLCFDSIENILSNTNDSSINGELIKN